MAESFPSVDATTNQLPLSVRTAIAANLADPSTVEGASLSDTIVAVGDASYVAEAGVGFDPVMRNATFESVASDPHYLRALSDGDLYAAISHTLYRATSEVGPWTIVHDFSDGFDAITDIRETGDGEVLVARSTDGVWKSHGWSSNPASATWSQTLVTASGTSPKTALIRSFGFDTDPVTGWAVVTCYSTAGDNTDSRYIWLSKDNGATWTVIFDAVAYAPEIDPRYKHMHIAAFDTYWSATTPRIWMSFHKEASDPTFTTEPYFRTMYSDDAGVTWSVLTSGAYHPVSALALPTGVVFSSDEAVCGVYFVARTPNPADMTYKLLYQIRQNLDSQWGYGSSAIIKGSIPGTAHVPFRSTTAGHNGIIVTTDGLRAAETAAITPTTGNSIDLQMIVEYKGRLLASYLNAPGDGSWSRMRIDSPRRGAGFPDLGGNKNAVALSLGAAYGENASADVRSVAIGANSVSGLRSTVIGSGAAADVQLGVAIGETATVTGANGTAIGQAASAVSGTSAGPQAVSVGDGTAIGYKANAIDETVSIGSFSNASGAQSTAVGRLAVASASNASAFGRGATASAVNSVAFGRGATAAFAQAVALGWGVSATAIGQVCMADRHIEQKVVTTPGAPAAGTARTFMRTDANGKVEWGVKFPSGSVQIVATDAGVAKAPVYATTGRPTAAVAGAGGMYFDTTLGKPVWSTGTVWVLADGTTA